MLEILARVEVVLPGLLQDERIWQSLYVDYHPPTVERLWTSWREYRVYLHRIHPCEREQALFHPHPWPSALRVLEGEYEMAVGFGAGMETPPVAVLMITQGDFRYEMTHPDSWHYVRPLGKPTLSVMVTGQPWDRESHKSDKPLRPLRPEQSAELLELFRARYPGNASWAVHRQDDNGNRFVVATVPTREEAERLVQMYEARGHKQLYWVEREPG